MKQFKCAVVGLGAMGAQHAELLSRLPAVELAVCCDVNESRHELCPAGVRFECDVDAVLAEPDLAAVIVATPEHAHVEVVVEALARGIHVLCEKPIATSFVDAGRIVAADDSSAASLAVGHVVRFDPRYRAVQAAVASDRLGRPLHMTTRRNNSVAYGARLAGRTTLPMYLSVHDVDILEWVMGSPIVRVFAEGSTAHGLAPGAFESVVATLRFANGAVASHEVSWGLPIEAGFASGEFAMSYVGTKGVAFVEIRSQGVTILGGGETGPTPASQGSGPGPGLVEFPGTMFNGVVEGLPFGVLRAQFEHFARACSTGERQIVTGREATRAMAVALALEESLRLGVPVEPLPSGANVSGL